MGSIGRQLHQTKIRRRQYLIYRSLIIQDVEVRTGVPIPFTSFSILYILVVGGIIYILCQLLLQVPPCIVIQKPPVLRGVHCYLIIKLSVLIECSNSLIWLSTILENTTPTSFTPIFTETRASFKGQ